MRYYGIDIHKKYSVYTAIDERGVILDQGKIPNEPEAFARVMNNSNEKAKAVIEATCNWYHIHTLLETMVEDVCVAHPLRTKAIASARIKTDKVDATTLAHLLRADLIPKSYIPPQEVRELRELLRYRASLVRMRTRVKNKVHALLTKHGLQHNFSDLFGKSGRVWLESLELRPIYRNALDGYLRILDSLNAEIIPVTRQIESVVTADPKAEILVSVPGIGPYTALLILAEIGDIERFPSPRHLVSYAGLVPSVHSSGGKTRYGRITKQGSPWLRWALTESAAIAVQRQGRLQNFHRRVSYKHGAKTARIAVAREMLRICYYLLKKSERYQE